MLPFFQGYEWVKWNIEMFKLDSRKSSKRDQAWFNFQVDLQLFYPARAWVACVFFLTLKSIYELIPSKFQ